MTSKTEALRIARSAVGPIHRRSNTDYVVYGPYRIFEPSGPSTEVQRNSYPQAQAERAQWVAEVALAAMGYDNPDISETVYLVSRDGGSAEQLVNRAIRNLGKPK